MKEMLCRIFNIGRDRPAEKLLSKFDHVRSELEEKENPNYVYFSVPGAGKLRFSKSCRSHTGRAFGFSVGASWSRAGYIGGVMDREEAKRMAEFILEEYAKITDEEKQKEQQSLIDRDIQLKAYFGKDYNS